MIYYFERIEGDFTEVVGVPARDHDQALERLLAYEILCGMFDGAPEEATTDNVLEAFYPAQAEPPLYTLKEDDWNHGKKPATVEEENRAFEWTRIWWFLDGIGIVDGMEEIRRNNKA